MKRIALQDAIGKVLTRIEYEYSGYGDVDILIFGDCYCCQSASYNYGDPRIEEYTDTLSNSILVKIGAKTQEEVDAEEKLSEIRKNLENERRQRVQYEELKKKFENSSL